MTPPPPAGTRRRTDAIAVGAFFVINGIVVGAFAGSLPGFRELFDLDNGHVVALLMVAGVVAVAAMQVAGRVSDRIGARVPSLLGAAVLAIAGVVMATADGYAWLVVSAVVFGLGNGILDVSMNAMGVVVEEARGGPIMSRFHAFFSIGNLVGAGVVAVIGGWQLRAPLLVGSGLVLGLLLWLRTSTPQTPRVAQHHEDGSRRSIPPLAWLLGAMAVCFGLTEGTAMDWSAIHTTDVTGVTANQGAWGLACVAGFMVLIRLLGDTAVRRLGRRVVVASGSACALVGYLVTFSFDALGVVLAGWCLVGFGVGLVAPQIYGLAGRVGGGRVLAVVVSFGYTAFLVGPALVGFLASQTATADRPGIQTAMLLPMLTAAALIVMALRMPADR